MVYICLMINVQDYNNNSTGSNFFVVSTRFILDWIEV